MPDESGWHFIQMFIQCNVVIGLDFAIVSFQKDRIEPGGLLDEGPPHALAVETPHAMFSYLGRRAVCGGNPLQAN